MEGNGELCSPSKRADGPFTCRIFFICIQGGHSLQGTLDWTKIEGFISGTQRTACMTGAVLKNNVFRIRRIVAFFPRHKIKQNNEHQNYCIDAFEDRLTRGQ